MNKLTKEALVSFKLTHPNSKQIDVARRYGVSAQYVNELWSKHFPNRKYNTEWGIKNIRKCKNCGKTFYVYVSEVKRGGGIYCSRKCKQSFKNT